MSGRPNNAGIYNYDNLNAQNLFIKGKRFEDYITELVFEDQFEAGEIAELQLLLQYLNTSGLSSEWIVDNNNKNQDLKTLITALETKLANIDTTTLTQSSVLNDANRNSVLKTRIDSADGSISTLNDKTRFITESVVGSNTANPKTPNSLIVSTNTVGVDKSDLRLVSGLSVIRMKGNKATEQNNNYEDNSIFISAPGQMITTSAHLNRIQASNKIEIGDINIQNSAAINIGGKGAQINIGAIDDPEVAPSANTVITIGKRATFRNTQTNLQGNVSTNEARLTDLSVTDVLTWGTAASWLSGFVFSGVPYWLAWVGLSGIPNYRYSDVMKMANNYLTGGLTKNNSIETSNDLALKAITIVNTDLVSLSTPFDGLLNRLVFQAFAIHGSHSIGTIWGKVNMYCGSGEIELRNDGSVFDWAFKNAGNSNQLLIKNLDVDLIQCNGNGNDGKLTLGACNGNIDLITGSNGIRSNATKVMEIKSNKQVLIGSNSAMVDNTYKVLVDATSHTNGIKVAKNSDALLLNPTNVSSKSLTLQDGYAGTTTKTLYTNANSDLMFDGQPVAVGSIAASGGGLTYVITAPSNTSITHANQVPTSLTMSSTYTSTPLRTATLSAYNVNTNYQIVSIVGAIPKAANPILSGTYELNQFVDYAANITGSLYAKLYFTALPLNNVLLNKTYTSPAGSGNVFNISTAEIKVPMNDVVINITSVLFPSLFVGGTAMGTTTLTLTAIDQTGTILHTFPAVNVLNQTTAGRLFIQSVAISDTTNITSIRFSLTATNQISQASAFNASNANYVIEGEYIRMLLYDGTTNPSALTPNASLLYPLSIPLPSAPFVTTDYENPNITLEEWFIQPTGSTTNHSVALRFNDGGLSHVHTSIASISAVPTLSSVMSAGNSVGSNALNMNSQNISNVATITANTVTPQAITGWNVKSLTAGNGITASNNGSGEWTITNTGIPVTPTIAQVLTAGNAAGNQNLSGINTLTATTITPTNITGWNVKNIVGGTNIVVSQSAGEYVISYDGAGSAYEASPDDYTITAVSAQRAAKPSWYGNTFYRNPAMAIANTCADVFMSSNGKIIAVVQRESGNDIQRPILYSTDYSVIYNTGGTSKNWISIAGTSTGDSLWAIQGLKNTINSNWPREIWRSTDQGATWTQRPSPPDFTNADPRRIRVSADGKFQLISDPRLNSLGKIYKSSDYGATWTSQNLTTLRSTAFAVAMSATGQVQYVEVSGTSEGLHSNNNNGGVYRSTNYGATWAYVLSIEPVGYISCDATGRIVALTTNFEVMTSRDYGITWKTITMAGATAVSVSPNGNIIWVGCINQTSTTQLYFSDDYGLSFSVRNQAPAGSYISTSYISIATNNDGTIVAGGGSGYFNVCRQNALLVADIVAGAGMSITTAGEGFYTIATTVTNDYQIFANGSVYVPYDGTTSNFIIDWLSSFGKIDLALYDIKYEIDIHWDANTSVSTAWPYAFIEMGLNKVMSIDNLNQGIIYQTATNWTNLINSGPFGANTEYNQSYAGRFYAGFSQTNNANGGGTPPWRYKTLLSGALKYTYRTVSQSGITDFSPNGRLLQNHFTCDSFLQQNTGSNTWGIWYDSAANDAHHNRIHGTALWDTSQNGRWDANSGTNEALSQGIYRIVLRLHEGANFLTLRPRGAQLLYRIYRIRK